MPEGPLLTRLDKEPASPFLLAAPFITRLRSRLYVGSRAPPLPRSFLAARPNVTRGNTAPSLHAAKGSEMAALMCLVGLHTLGEVVVRSEWAAVDGTECMRAKVRLRAAVLMMGTG